MTSKTWEIILEKWSKNRLNPTNASNHLRQIAESAGRNKRMGFSAKSSKISEPSWLTNTDGEEMYNYRAKITITKERVLDDGASERQFLDHILPKVILRTAASKGWSLVENRVNEVDPEDEDSPLLERPRFKMPVLNQDSMEAYFGHVYERDAHIRLIYDSAKAYERSNGKIRSNICLFGPPAGGKTTLYESFKAFIEQEEEAVDDADFVERVAEIDGPTMSKAGLENWILDKSKAGRLPEFLIIEEIEKQPMDNLLSLLSVMASGRIRKMNAHRGNDSAVANCVIWATCNDEELLKKFRAGALWSRFQHRLYCKLPSTSLMRRILSDKIEEMGGDQKWVDEAMEFAYNTYRELFGYPIGDPRQIISLLDGGDRLMDGSYQDDLIEVFSAQLSDGKDLDLDIYQEEFEDLEIPA